MRGRVTVTIRDDLLRSLDRMVDGLSIRSRSQAMEFVLSKQLSEFRVGSALILAGGPRKRLMIGKKPRFLANIAGKPLIERVIENLANENIANFTVYSDSFADEIRNSLEKGGLPYNISFLRGEKSTGTVEPLLKAKSRLKETFLVAYGDTICRFNLSDMVAFHRENNSAATIALTTVSNPKDFGVAVMEGSRIVEFEEKPRKGASSYQVNAGYFLFEPSVLKHIEPGMKNLERDLFPKLAEKGLLYGYPFRGMYLNVNTKRDIERAKVLLK